MLAVLLWGLLGGERYLCYLRSSYRNSSLLSGLCLLAFLCSKSLPTVSRGPPDHRGLCFSQLTLPPNDCLKYPWLINGRPCSSAPDGRLSCGWPQVSRGWKLLSAKTFIRPFIVKASLFSPRSSTAPKRLPATCFLSFCLSVVAKVRRPCAKELPSQLSTVIIMPH